MKLTKDISINPEMGFYPPIIDKKTGKILIGRWIGSVEVVIDGYHDEDGWEYITELYLAYQLISGRIVYVEECDPELPMTAHSLKGKLYDIRWGYYPVGFRNEWQYYITTQMAVPEGITTVKPDELPF